MTIDNVEPEVKLTYEEALQALEESVSKLEKGDLPLEEALSAYQRGVELAAYCAMILNKVEENLALLNTNKGEE